MLERAGQNVRAHKIVVSDLLDEGVKRTARRQPLEDWLSKSQLRPPGKQWGSMSPEDLLQEFLGLSERIAVFRENRNGQPDHPGIEEGAEHLAPFLIEERCPQGAAIAGLAEKPAEIQPLDRIVRDLVLIQQSLPVPQAFDHSMCAQSRPSPQEDR